LHSQSQIQEKQAEPESLGCRCILSLFKTYHWLYTAYDNNMTMYTVWAKKSPLTFSPNGWEFLTNFYTPITRSFLYETTNFCSIISNFDDVMPY